MNADTNALKKCHCEECSDESISEIATLPTVARNDTITVTEFNRFAVG